MSSVFLIDPGLRPDFADIADHLWGVGCAFDSDGDAAAANDRNWTELTLTLRPAYQARIDVDPLDDLEPLVLVIRSDNDELTEKAGLFLHSACGGALSDTAPVGRGNGS
jgi:hypothetical protein